MKIKQNLPQFKDARSLIIVSGAQEGFLYLAYNEEIDKIEHIFEETPSYSDREGHFMKSGTNQDVVQGSVYENKKNYIKKSFIKRSVETIKSIVKKYDIKFIYIFSPQYLEKDLLKTLPNSVNEKVVETFLGNYSNEHEFKLLEKIKEKRDKNTPVRPISSEALKLKKRKSSK